MIEVERLNSDVDISGVVVTRIAQVDKGKVDLTLTGDADLGGGINPGRGVYHPVDKLLADVVQQINEMFAGELPSDVIEGFVNPVLRKALEADGIRGQIDSNALDQFLNSHTLRDALVDASLSTETDVSRLIELITGEGDLTDQLIEILGRYLYEREHGREHE